MTGKSQSKNIVETMRSELAKNKGDWTRLSAVSKIPYRWIVAFADRDIKNPSFDRVSHLGRYIGMKVVVIPCSHFNKFRPEEE